MIAVVGLGNPGRQYEKSRHNAGFFIVDLIRQKTSSQYSVGKNYEYFDFDAGVGKVRFIRPQTYMNLSGEIFQHLRNDNIETLIVVVDNIDLELGRLRLRNGGGSAGHNGLKSIIANYPLHENFIRLYVGAGREAGREAGRDAAEIVLEKLYGESYDLFESECVAAADILLKYLSDGDMEAAVRDCGNYGKKVKSDNKESSEGEMSGI